MSRLLGASLSTLQRDRTSVKWQVYPPDVLPLWVAEMDVSACPAVVEAVSAAVRRGDTGYTWATPYAEAFSAFAQARWGWGPDPDQMESSPDVMIGIRDLIEVCTEPGDAVIVSPPVYNAFYGFIEGYGRRVVEAPMRGGRLDAAALESAFAQSTMQGRRAAYLLSNPHNPLGTVHSAEELSQLALLADRYDVQVISDEIHAPLIFPGVEFVPYLSLDVAQRGITMFSASKSFNLAGLKCALMVCGAEAGPVMKRIPEVARHGASHVAAIAHTAALVDGQDWLDQLLKELLDNRNLLHRRVIEDLPGVIFAPPQATYLAWLDFRRTALAAHPHEILLQRARVALSRGSDFGSPGVGHARLNFATSPEVLTEAVRRIRRVMTR